MPLSAGTRLGPYEILALIGSGGMGEVYRAQDARLNRTIAIKVLPAQAADRPEMRERFEREARAVSALNHPHICGLYDIGQQAGIDYFVMEYLEGETLAARLQKGPLPLDQLLRYAIQIADALTQAHRRGVLHRDLKPANIMLTKAGAKLLDFGLAKLRGPNQQAEALATMSLELTQKGTILGTLQYMAPEQLESKETDARTDIFAFGAVLYEIATGRKAFEGRSQASLISAIMSSEPAPISTLKPLAPPALDHVIRRCLAKDPEARWQTAQDVLAELKWIDEAGSQTNPVAKRRTNREPLAWALAGVFAVSLAFISTLHFTQPEAEGHPIRFSLAPPNKVNLGPGDVPTISPNGRRLVFAGTSAEGKRFLWLRSLDSTATVSLAGSDGATAPFWSADSRSVAFFAEGKLKRVDVAGGPPQTVCESGNARFGAWNRDGVIVLGVPGGPLHRVPAAGGDPKPLLDLDKSRQEIAQSFPNFLPDGRHYLYLSRSADAGKTGVYLGSLDSKETKPVRISTAAKYSPPGFLLFGRQETLLAQPFDGRKLAVTGEPVRVTEQVGQFGPVSLFSVSQNGVLVYRAGPSANIQLAWCNRDGKRLPIGDPGPYNQIVLSPDEKRVSVERIDSGSANVDLWLLDLSSGIFSRLTFDPARDSEAVWSPNSRELIFISNRKGRYNLYRKVIGGGEEELLFESDEDKYPQQWLKDGSILFHPNRSGILYRLLLEGERKPTVLFRSAFESDLPRISPDGRWIAYQSIESNRWEVFVARFPAFTDKRQVSNAGGCQPMWRKDGRELFYLSLEGNMMVLDTKAGGDFSAGLPHMLFQTRMTIDPVKVQYGVTGDGKRFMIGEPAEASDKPINVVVNWSAELRK
jgi:eukaryotic-like serine/threonine-protein kinase